MLIYDNRDILPKGEGEGNGDFIAVVSVVVDFKAQQPLRPLRESCSVDSPA
ncbi:hypothetical protein [Syntrophotalea acetylenivorans]|uniref:hypothetical protein n=1 Tax=Syntrophotalea acetylenivorans TaxID=1842532 RepID=UPI000A692B09|nr:hypothetical protein [Syntrophotalea acetylenivorans]